MISSSYRYNVDAMIILDNENIEIQKESLTAITIDSNYDIYNRPIIYLTLNIQSRIYDKLVLNNKSATINLRVRKLNNGGGGISLGKDYIHDSFSYLIKSDPDYYSGIKENPRIEDGVDEDVYMSGTIALFKKESLDKIKQLHYNIIKNSNMASIIHRYTKDKKMIIEPLHSTDKFDTIIVPPLESLTDVLSFLNNFDAFYDRKYRYFEDFDVTYLLNDAGNAVHGTDKYDTVIIDIVDSTDERSKISGVITDSNQSAYILYIDAQDSSLNIDKVSNIEYDSIIAVSSTGDVYKTPLRENSDNTEKCLIQRVYNSNYRLVDNFKHAMNSSSTVLQVSKSEIDSSIITPNKEYLINNYDKLKEYNGKFTLSFKKEVLIQQDMEFISNTIIGLRKIEE